MKTVLQHYLGFSKKETIAVLILVILIFIAIYMPSLFILQAKPVKENLEIVQQLQALDKEDSIQYSKNKPFTKWQNYEAEKVVFNPFIFNPNTITEQQWSQLGLRSKTIKTILNYRNKGGRFYKAIDIKKIWGITNEESERLIPYIQIEESKNYTKHSSTTIPKIVDINEADAKTLLQIPGLKENGLAFKLVSFREKLGGFITKEQIKETYGFTDSNFVVSSPFLICNSNNVKKLNINTASDVELNNHPYIEKHVAKAIVVYRAQKGNYLNVSDIKKIVFIKEPLYNKIAPYLTVD